MPISFIDLQRQRETIADNIDAAIQKVLSHGQYILGPEVQELEQQLQQYTSSNHCVTCANGTDALALILMAENIGVGDAVIIPNFTFIATAEIICNRGATPILCDIGEDYNIDCKLLTLALQKAVSMGLKPRAVIAVDLYGLPADYDVLNEFAENNNLLLIADAAQSFGGAYNDKNVGNLAAYTTTSFFPAKPLGCYGDGGAIFTNNEKMYETLKSIRFHGKGKEKYDHIQLGVNSRLDTIQAAILLEKLKIFPSEIAKRQEIADYYSRHLNSKFITPTNSNNKRSAWAQYTIRTDNRDAVIANCKNQNIPTAIHYPCSISNLTPYKNYPLVTGNDDIAKQFSQTVLSLPMHPYLTKAEQDLIISCLNQK